MRLTENYSISDRLLKEVQSKSAKELKAWIKGLNLFAGLPTQVAKQKERAVYEKIYVKRPKKRVRKANP